MTPDQDPVRAAVRRGLRRGFLEGLDDLRSRLFIAGSLCGTGGTLGAVLVAGENASRTNMLAACIACSVVGVALFSLPSAPDE